MTKEINRLKPLLVALACIISVKESEAQKKGSFTDPRDGKTYKTVTVGKQIWMAENLNYATKEGSWCYEEISNYCTTYGRLYNYYTVKEACPQGWHLPTADEWDQLITYLGGEKVAGQKLKAEKGWMDSETRGTNSSGFSALPGGSRNYGAVFVRVGSHVYYWSATELGGGAHYFELSYDNNVINRYASNSRSPGFSVRCVCNE